jgi:hypothetical protein
MNKVVEPESATLGIPFEEMDPLDANHQTMVRFMGLNDHIFQKVVAKLRLILCRVTGNVSASNPESETGPFNFAKQGMNSTLVVSGAQHPLSSSATEITQHNCDDKDGHPRPFSNLRPSYSRNENPQQLPVIPLSLLKLNSDQASVSIRGLQRKCGIRMANEDSFDWSPLDIQINIPRSTSIKSLMNQPADLFYITSEDEDFTQLPELEPFSKTHTLRMLV